MNGRGQSKYTNFVRPSTTPSSPSSRQLASVTAHVGRGQKRKLSAPLSQHSASPYYPPVEKQRKFSTPSPLANTSTWAKPGGGIGRYTFAGQEAEKSYPDSKTVLNNTLQQQLRQAEMKLNYDVTKLYLPEVKRQIFRCALDIPVPEPFTAIGEGDSRKDAEKRASAAACVKLYELGIIDGSGKVLTRSGTLKRQEVDDDRKPKYLEVSMAGRLQLFDAIASLPQCASFANWGGLVKFYEAQRRERKGKVSTSEASFELALNPLSNKPLPSSSSSSSSQVSKKTNVLLPASLRHTFPPGVLTSLASLPCPHCLEKISITLSAHLGTTLISANSVTPQQLHARPSLPPTDQFSSKDSISTVSTTSDQSDWSQTQCAFTGRLCVAPTESEVSSRNADLKSRLEIFKNKFCKNSPKGSPQYTAQHLPVADMRNAIVTAVNTNTVVIISGMTGSGKTTQVPQYLLENYVDHDMGCHANIIVTQPRRISAISIAERVATERGEMLGDTIGFQVRLESRIPQYHGRILYCTTGILLMRLRKNPQLTGVSHVIVDEVHERDINTDFLLILLREIVRSGRPLKVILMSASLDSERFASYFKGIRGLAVPQLNVQGRVYPVTSHYLEDVCNLIGWRDRTQEDPNSPETNVELVSNLVVHLARHQPEGAILVFLPGWDDIMGIQDLLQNKLYRESHRYQILPLHSMLSSESQQAVFRTPPSGVRKIILATNIAESSVTIDDIVYVVNTGTVKVKTFDPGRKISMLQTQWASKSSVTQRQGRAGRCQAGHCYNLFTKQRFRMLDDYEVPEIQRMPLEELVLQTKVLNPGQSVAHFLSKALNPPHLVNVAAAVMALRALGALTDQEELTSIGRVLAELPIEPRVGRLILLGAAFRTLDPTLTIAAAMGYKDPFVSPPTKRHEADECRSRIAAGCYSDHLLLLRAYDGWSHLAEGGGSTDEEYRYIRDNFLHRGSLRVIAGLRKQFKRHLEGMGFSNMTRYNQFSWDEGMVRGMLTVGLYPSVVKVAKMVESGGMRGDTQRKRVRPGFSTIEDGRVFMHPSSVNSEKSFPANWFVYYEKVKTSRVYIRDSSLIHPLHLLLFAGGTMDILSEDSEKAVVALDNQDWFAFELPLNLADLLLCARQAIAAIVEAGISGQSSQLPETHLTFLQGLSKFLSENAKLDDSPTS